MPEHDSAGPQKSADKAAPKPDRSTPENGLFTDYAPSARGTHAKVLQLQRQLGNRAVNRMVGEPRQAPSMVLNHVAEPAIQREGGAEPAVNPEKAEDDFKRFIERLQLVKQLYTSEFIALMRSYVDAIKANDRDTVNKLIDQIVAVMDRQRAFQIRDTVYRDVTDTSGDIPREMAQKAQQAAEGVTLWSKLTALPPLRRIQETGKGVSLESSVAGTLFDGITFGVPWGNTILEKQWKLISQSFVKYAQGVVHSMVLGGVHPKSVFFTTEWPIIREYLKTKQVTALIVHVYDVPADNYDGELFLVKRYWVLSEGDFDKIPKVNPDDQTYQKKQDRVYANYKELNEESSRFQNINPDA